MQETNAAKLTTEMPKYVANCQCIEIYKSAEFKIFKILKLVY